MSTQPHASTTLLSRFWIAGALLTLILASGALLLIRATAPESTDLEEQARAREPDVHMEGAVLRQFDATGQLEYALISSDIRLFREQGRAELLAPDLTLYESAQSAWQVRAATGTLLGRSVGGSGEDQVQLRDDVLLQPIEGHEQVRLSTAALTLYPERQYAESDQAVIIDARGGRTAAAGLEGDLQGGLFKLLSSPGRPVQTVLLPGQFK